MLLSAGLGGTAGYWTPQLAALRERYRVVTYDQAGTGRNRRELPADHSIAAMADEVLAVLDATGTPACHFVGHALGGLAGLDLAMRRPDRLSSLTVVNGWAAAHAHTRRCFEMRLALLKHGGPAAYVRAQPIFLYPADWLARNADRVEQEEAHGLAGFQGANTLQRRIAALLAFDATPRLGALRLPTLLVAARDDVLVPSRVRRACSGDRGSDPARRALGRSRPQRDPAGRLQFPLAGLPGPASRTLVLSMDGTNLDLLQ